MTDRVDVGDRIAGESSTRSWDSKRRRPKRGIGDFGRSCALSDSFLRKVERPAKRLETWLLRPSEVFGRLEEDVSDD